MTRTHAALPLLAGLLCVCCVAQALPREIGIPQIKSIVNNIDSHLKELKESRATLQTGTDRGGQLTIYRRGSDVVRIDAIISGSNSDLQNAFYYSGMNLIFVKTKAIIYPYSSTLSGFDFATPHVKTTGDYYVRDRKLIPLGRAKTSPDLELRLLQEAELFKAAIRHGNQVVDIEKLLK
jgi:hypothetical protein